jgi:Arc/MetJ-type ribon-helix-helix transcriptional regulator
MQTERVTLRLQETTLAKMDALIRLGEYGNRTEIIRQALKHFLKAEGEVVESTIKSEENMQKLLKLAALAEQSNLFQSL